jgi:endonuclease YncB( thermonuclease family)
VLTCSKKDVDRYRRFVGQCLLPDGRDIACEQVKAGHAVDWPKYSRGHYYEWRRQSVPLNRLCTA